ncbi:uncharacterized protein LOC126900165 isoform X2 [Daktulosphaira vitifoliae]|uniref:uncharacterized protein LOC126900165 isoform X2 n=1 Tax=Daktulosphaira vitifoliae TaxID=58002 RepID=UPI0021A9A670|nr:uncharacterized protein LOC126900165 isoform X2 [Daktulosphaira vitifoliae]
MDLDLIQDIREMMHGLAERKQRKDTVALIQTVLFKQMTLLVYKAAYGVSNEKKIENISVKDIIFVLKNHKHTLIRMLRYYLLKGNMYKFTAVTNIEKTEENLEESKAKKPKLDNSNLKAFDSAKEIAEATSDFDFHDTNGFDLISSWVANSSCKNQGNSKKPTVYNSIMNAIEELNINVDLTNENDVRNATEPRKVRADELALILSPSAYECFQVCRTRIFHNKKGEMLIEKVCEALPFNIKYKSQELDILLYLAKETIATLIDRVYQNKEKIITNKQYITNPEKTNNDIQVKKPPITVEDIIETTQNIWKQPIDYLPVPLKENDEFFKSELIFD